MAYDVAPVLPWIIDFIGRALSTPAARQGARRDIERLTGDQVEADEIPLIQVSLRRGMARLRRGVGVWSIKTDRQVVWDGDNEGGLVFDLPPQSGYAEGVAHRIAAAMMMRRAEPGRCRLESCRRWFFPRRGRGGRVQQESQAYCSARCRTHAGVLRFRARKRYESGRPKKKAPAST